MALNEAWANGRPILRQLPGVNEVYNQENTLPDYLTGYWDSLLVDIKNAVDDIGARQLNPLTCDEKWLDFLAPLCGWDSTHWNPNWPASGKRILLANSYRGVSIWETKGNQQTLSFILAAVGIRNYIRLDSDFIVGTSEVGDEIGEQPWEFMVYLPYEYQNQPQQREASRLIPLFSPAWCLWSYVWRPSNEFYAAVIGLDGDTAVGTDDNQVIQVN